MIRAIAISVFLLTNTTMAKTCVMNSNFEFYRIWVSCDGESRPTLTGSGSMETALSRALENVISKEKVKLVGCGSYDNKFYCTLSDQKN